MNAARSKRDELVYLPLGGAGEIGMNLYLYGLGPPAGRQWIMVDLGIAFGDLRDPGIDVILPDTSFIEEERSNLHGIVLTHAHEDHFGAVAYLWPRLKVPVYATKFTAGLLAAKLTEFGLEDEVPVKVIASRSRFGIGPFDIELIDMAHSIPEPNALAIRTSLGTVLHSGDWKIDTAPVIEPRTDEAALKALGEEGCLALICDSTNALREGASLSETAVADGLAEIIAGAKGRVAVTTFASNVGRLQSIGRATRAAGRHLFIAGRAMHRILEVSREVGYLRDLPDVIDEEEFAQLPPDKVVCLCTGSQGERRAALSRIAEGNHPISLSDGDLVIFSSRTIPGNEKAVGEVVNNLAMRGVEVITGEDAPVHVSGHPRREELAQLYDWVNPDLLIPMHGEARHMFAHAEFARSRGIKQTLIVRNGDMVKIAPGPPAIIDEAPAGRLHLDGGLILDGGDGPVRVRRKLGYAGAVSITLVIDDKGTSRTQHQIALFGLPEEGASGELFGDIIADTVDDVLDSLPRSKRRDHETLAETVRRAVVREVEMAWGKRPLCQVNIARL